MGIPGMMIKKRLAITMLVVVALFFALFARLFIIQVVQSKELQNKAADQWTRSIPVEPKRGQILDRNGTPLAQSATVDTVVLRPSEIEDANAVANTLAPILGMTVEEIYKKATLNKSEVWLKRQITTEQSKQILELKSKGELVGVLFTDDCRRYYSKQNFLTQVLGYTSIDGEGQEGLEAYYNKYLKGIPGQVVNETDARGREMYFSQTQYIPPEDGYDLVLTIDTAIQSFAESAMEEALIAQKAKKVEAIVMDPRTGEILAMVNKPDFDANNPPRNDLTKLNALSRNATVLDVYEPGSTLKVITTASAIETGKVNTNSSFFCPGYRIVDGEKIKCWRSYNPHGSQDLQLVLKNSCNPAFMDMALAMGRETFYEYLKKFGFSSKTGVGFNGEESGILMPVKYVRNVDLARIGFGQSIAVTPMQLATAVSAVVNGGKLMQPFLVKEINDAKNDKIIQQFLPIEVRQVVSEATSKTMRTLLEQVVAQGVVGARIPGYRVGGKTGTAQKYENGIIALNKHVSSFIGFAPADNPQIVVLVIVDEPNVAVDFGSIVAAPYARQIMENTLQYLGIKPSQTGTVVADVEVPEVKGLSLSTAMQRLREAGLEALASGDSGVVISQMPPAGSKVQPGTAVLLSAETGDAQNASTVVVPDVYGKSVQEANQILAASGFLIKIQGSGVAYSQSPSAGTRVKYGTEVIVAFKMP